MKRLQSVNQHTFLVLALIAGLSWIPVGQMIAQTFTTLHSFTSSSDGANPYAALILTNNTLYGTAQNGGSQGYGTVFKVNTDGTGYTNLHTFTPLSGPSPSTNSEGAYPRAGLTLSGNALYGTAASGGSAGRGTVFMVNTDGTGFTNLHSFTALANSGSTNSDGAIPVAGLILLGDTLYGTAANGGRFSGGTVFAVNTDGTGFTTLHSLNYGSDGAVPRATLILSGNTLYGTAQAAGSSGYGTVFKVNTNGTGFTTLHSFAALSNSTNAEGVNPLAGLVLSGNTLYGTAGNGGTSGKGTVFKVNTDGTGFTNLHSLSPNADGATPYAGLILSGDTLYGTTSAGGSSSNGTVFAVKTDGTGFTTLHGFTATPAPYTNIDGAIPYAGLILSGNTLYGMAAFGGSSGHGTVFSLSLGSVSPPQLTITPSGANVILTWPANASGFTLQFTTNLGSSDLWNTVFPEPTVVNGENTVTDPISDTGKFYRLIQ
jgi:uncharacterized repeat protein (TIGR03803 family)